MPDKIKIYEYFMEPDGTPKKQLSALVTSDGDVIEQSEGSGKDGLYIWEIPVELLGKGIRVSIPEFNIDRDFPYSASMATAEVWRISEMMHGEQSNEHDQNSAAELVGTANA